MDESSIERAVLTTRLIIARGYGFGETSFATMRLAGSARYQIRTKGAAPTRAGQLGQASALR